MKAELPEYVMGSQGSSRLARGATANADFVLHPACLEEGSYVDGGLRWGLQAAQAILYVRFTAVSEPDRWIVNDQCIVGIDHTTNVLSILNMGADSGTIKKTIHIVRDGRVGWKPGDEYIAFVRWEPAIGRYRPIAGPIFMIPVLNGKVVWDRTDAPQYPDRRSGQQGDGEPLALLPSARAAR